MHRRFTLVLRLSMLAIMLTGALFPPQGSAYALTTLTVTPLSWNVIGLDSNSPTSGPYRFPIGAQVCASGYTYPQTITSSFVFDDGADLYTGGSFINLRSGSFSSVSLTFNSNGCQDVYFEVEVKQLSGAYDTTRAYHITATDGILPVPASTPTTRELYVEHLISQSRNSITNVQLNGTSIPAGGAMTLMVGNTYTITLTGGTATQGYNQFESFINFPNTIFQVLSVSTTYSADDSPYVPAPNPQLYADACKWENNPASPYYRSCIGGDYKAGGSTVVTTYVIKVISGGGTSQTLNTLLYDFSGSSYHYNADYSTGFRIANIIDPSNVTVSKSFSPNPTNVNGISALTITLTNPNPGAISGYNFTDPLPANMKVASPSAASTSGCGATPPLSFNPQANDTTLTFTGGTLAANSSCVIKVNVTTTTTGSFNNTTTNLKIDSLDTGKFGQSTLTVNTAPPAGTGICPSGVVLASWTMAGTTAPPAYTAPLGANVSAATTLASYTGTGTSAIDTGNGFPANSWGVTSGWSSTNTGFPNAVSPYFLFQVDTTNYTNVSIAFDFHAYGNWAVSTNNYLYAYSSSTTDTTAAYTNISTTTNFSKNDATWTHVSVPANATGATTTYFRINAVGQQSTTAQLDIDNFTVTGTSKICPQPTPPTIAKSFSPGPVAINGTSTLTFTLSNTNSTQLTGAKFQDTLPTGLVVASPATFSTTCTGSPTWAPVAGSSQLDFGQTVGANIPASSLATPGTCTVSVLVRATTAGPHNNVSGFLSTTESGTNTSSVASANLTAVLPPTISKLFTTDPILAGGISTLAFTITNPNQSDALAGIAFTDTFPIAPGAMTVASPLTTTNSCGGTLQDNLGGVLAAGDVGIRLTGGTLTGGGSCTVTVKVTAPTIGTYLNKNVTVSHVINAATVNGNTASATLTVSTPHPAVAILKQVSASSTGPWYSFLPVSSGATVYYRFIIENAGDIALSGITVSDNVLGAICTIAGPLNPFGSSTCTASTAATGSGTHTNIATASVTYSGTPYSDTSTAAYGIATLNLTKRADETYFLAAGNTLHYYYDVTTTSTYPLLGPVTITDDKTTVTCPALSTVGNGDDYLNSGETLTCSATYNVAAGDVTAKLVTNTATARMGAVTSNASSKTIPLAPDLTLAKTNNTSDSVAFGSTFAWTLTVNNSASAGAATFTVGQTIIVDDLPVTGATYSVGSITYGTTSGTISCSIVSNTLTCIANESVTIPSGGSFSVPVTVTPTSTGTLTNPRTGGACQVDPVTGVIPELDESNNSCTTNTVTVLDRPTITKVFSPTTIPAGGTSTITFTLTNPNAGALTNANFTDTLTNMSVASTTIGGTCVGVSNSPALAVGATALNLTIPSLPAGGCTVTVAVTSSTVGVHPNVTSGVTTTQTTVGNPSPSVDLTVLGRPTILKAFSPTTIRSGDISTITFTLTNPNASTLTNAIFTDALDNMTVASTTIGGTCVGVTNSPALTVGTTDLNLTVPNLASGFCTVTVDVTSNVLGVHPNVASGVTTTQTPIGTPSTSVNLTVLGKPTIAKAFSPATITSGDTSTITFTLTNPNTGALTNATFTDTLTNMSVASTILGGTCVGVSNTPALSVGDTALNLSLPNLASGSCTITVVVTSGTLGVNPNITSGVTTTQTTVGNPSNSVDLTVLGKPAITKAFSPATITSGGTSTITFTLTNPNASELTNANFTDTLTNMNVSSTTVGGTCAGVTNSPALTVGATALNLTIPSLPSGGCTVTVVVTSSTLGVNPNTASGVTTNQTTVGNPSPSADLTVIGKPTIAKVFSSATILSGGTSTITFTLTNPNASALTNANFTDTLANMSVASTMIGGSCVGVTNSPALLAGATALNLTVPSLPAAGCTITILVTSSSVGVNPNTTSGVTTTQTTVGTPSNTANLTVTNLLPVATNNTYTILAGSTSSGNVMTDGTADTLGDPPTTVTAFDATSANSGTVTVAADGSFTYDPNGFVGTDTFTYTIADINGDSSTATVIITITAVDDAPVADDDTNATTEDTPVTDTVIGNDTLSSDGGNTWSLVGVNGGALHGTVTMNAAGTYTYIPNANYNGTDVFTYQICDTDTGANLPNDCDSATVTITIDPVDDAPVANDDTNTTNEDTPVNGDVSGNDILSGDGGNTWNKLTDPTNGTVVFNSDGTYTYTPNANYNGTDSFTYEICDVDGDCDPATVTITISPVDDVPVANDDTNTTNEDTPVNGDVTGNDTLSGDGGNTWSLVGVNGGALHGTVTMNAAGAYTYTPNANYNGTDVFNYQICDVDGDCDSATVTITITAVDDVPVANDDTNTTTEATPVNGDVSGNDTPSGDGGNTWNKLTDPTNGTVTFNSYGAYTYTPNAIFNGTDSFTYEVCDVDGDCDPATVTITVVNLPDAIDDTDTTNEGTPVTTSVLSNDDLGATPTTITSNTQGANGTVSCTTTQCTYTPNAGFGGTDTYTYTITDNNGNTDTATVTIMVNKSLIGISKRVVSKTEVSPGTWDVTYEVYVENFGSVALNGIQVLDDLTITFPAPTTFTVQSVTSTQFTENPGYNGNSNPNLLAGTDSLAVGANGTITVIVRVQPHSAGPFNNIAIASGQCPTCSTPVTDMSQDGTDPDPDSDNNPTNNNISTPVNFGPNLFDPPFGLKVLDASGLPVLQWTMVWINNSNIVAVNAQVSDPIVAGTTFVPGSLTCTPSGVTTTSSCTYDLVTNRVIWSGNLGPDLGATDAASAANEITITFRVDVAAGITSVLNVATIDADLNGNLLATDPGEQQVASASARWSAAVSASNSITLPKTGFAPNVVTDLRNVPTQAYLDTNGVTVEIPSLGVKIPVVGVPKKNGTWNVSWLGNQAGWLAGTAFPSWSGNSVLTGHVYNSNGLPGPFVNLNKLKYGDQIIIHAYGQNYIFEVRSDEVVEPNDKSVLKHEEKPWLTLVTCKDYDEKTNTYKKRVVVRAVLVKVTTE